MQSYQSIYRRGHSTYSYRVHACIMRQLVLWDIHTNKINMEVSSLGVNVLYFMSSVIW